MSSAGANLDRIQKRLHDLGRDDVRVIAVTKTHGPERIEELLALGHRDFGENRQNEGRDKFAFVDPGAFAVKPIYHHIGPLQSGSARQIPGLFHWVHGASSISALGALIKAATSRQAPVDYLVQVDFTAEPTKSGGMEESQARETEFPESDLVRFRGFMTMGPESIDPTETRAVFRKLRSLRDEILPGGELSMGMSSDWEWAVEEGATMVRLGGAIFGDRGQAAWKP